MTLPVERYVNSACSVDLMFSSDIYDGRPLFTTFGSKSEPIPVAQEKKQQNRQEEEGGEGEQ